jgi:hypothetical protein
MAHDVGGVDKQKGGRRLYGRPCFGGAAFFVALARVKQWREWLLPCLRPRFVSNSRRL